MHIGLTMECDYREGQTQGEAFDEAFHLAEEAETLGLDGVWLSERHFARPGGIDGIPSVVAAPLIFATAVAMRTSRLRVGVAVLVLPLGHPVRMAEEIATLDNISHGRFDLGVGRSSFPSSYKGYDLNYGESRERFSEHLEVMRKAWTQERFSYKGKYYTFENVCLVPKPYQKPHPPIRVAITTRENFALLGRQGLPIFVGLRSMMVDELAKVLEQYRKSWREAGHPGEGDVILRIPVYVAKDEKSALSEPKASTLHSYKRMRNAYLKSNGKGDIPAEEELAGQVDRVERVTRAESLVDVSYENLLTQRVVYGTPEVVAARLADLHRNLGLSGITIEPNVGGRMSHELVINSLRLLAQEVIPQLR